MKFLPRVVLGLGVALSIGCSGVSTPSSNTTETFSGTIAVAGFGAVHPFTATKTGEFTVTVTAISPDGSARIGILYGQAVSGGCAAITSFLAGVGSVPFNELGIQQGNYCVQLYDPTNTVNALTRAENYTVTVSHP